MGRLVYMYTTKDKYEFPLGVADSIDELARITGKKKASIISALGKSKRCGFKSSYLEVEIDDDEGEEE